MVHVGVTGESEIFFVCPAVRIRWIELRHRVPGPAQEDRAPVKLVEKIRIALQSSDAENRGQPVEDSTAGVRQRGLHGIEVLRARVPSPPQSGMIDLALQLDFLPFALQPGE